MSLILQEERKSAEPMIIFIVCLVFIPVTKFLNTILIFKTKIERSHLRKFIIKNLEPYLFYFFIIHQFLNNFVMFFPRTHNFKCTHHILLALFLFCAVDGHALIFKNGFELFIFFPVDFSSDLINTFFC